MHFIDLTWASRPHVCRICEHTCHQVDLASLAAVFHLTLGLWYLTFRQRSLVMVTFPWINWTFYPLPPWFYPLRCGFDFYAAQIFMILCKWALRGSVSASATFNTIHIRMTGSEYWMKWVNSEAKWPSKIFPTFIVAVYPIETLSVRINSLRRSMSLPWIQCSDKEH